LTRDAVLAAVREHDELGRTRSCGVLDSEGLAAYFLLLNNQRYDSKANVGTAHKFVRAAVGPLR
jgi:hypothetical protein